MSQMKNKWLYGKSWEKFPIQPGEVWKHAESRSLISVSDLRYEMPEFMYEAEMIYCDPPWNKGNCNCFLTKAGNDDYIHDYMDFVDCLFALIYSIDPVCCYLEIGKQYCEEFQERLSSAFTFVNKWSITYYKKHPCFLLRGGYRHIPFDFSGMDEEKTPLMAAKIENTKSIGDLCTGRGLSLMAAHKNKKRFLGIELNKRRLAVAIDRASKIGIEYRP